MSQPLTTFNPVSLIIILPIVFYGCIPWFEYRLVNAAERIADVIELMAKRPPQA